MKKVFLGGTVVGIDQLYGWRGKLIPMLKIPYFNPVVKKYGKIEREEEYNQKEKICDFNLFVITPDIRGYFSIAEVTDLSNKKPKGTILCVLDETFENDRKFNKAQLASLDRVGEMIVKNGAKYFKSLKEVADYLNQ